MKKYFMLTITAFMLLLTAAAFRYENSGQAPQIKQPSISIESQKFGLIKRIIWTNSFMNDNKSLIILSTKTTEQGIMSCLYNLNTDTGKSELLSEFPAHKNLYDVILFDAPMGLNNIIAAYDKGIVKIKYASDHSVSAADERIAIDGFDTATSMDFKSRLTYTRENDSLLYVKELSNSGFGNFFTNNPSQDITSYYLKPFYVANYNSLDNIIAYTSINRNRINLYAARNGVPVTTLNKPVIENVVSAHGIEDSFGFVGMNIAGNSKYNKMLNLFMIRKTIDKYNNDDYYNLDTIPYNTDPFGAVPAVDSTTYNAEFSLAYTSYDDSHRGSLKICGLNQKPKSIISGENIFGPVSMTKTYTGSRAATYILYFTLENNNIKVKICNDKGELVKDITDMVLKNN